MFIIFLLIINSKLKLFNKFDKQNIDGSKIQKMLQFLSKK